MTETPLRRRQVLVALGSVSTAIIAGCSGGGDDDGGSSPDSPSPTPTPTTPNQEAVEHYNEAIDALVSIKETLDGWAENGFHGGASDLRELRDTLSTGKDALGSAENAADSGGEFIERVEQAKLVATLQEGSISFYDLVLDLVHSAEDGFRFQENDNFERAVEVWAEAEQLARDVRNLFDDTQSVHEQLNTDILDEPELDYSGDFIDYLDLDHRQAIDAVETYSNGFEQYNLALVRVRNGLEAWENGEIVNARSEWETGRSRLEAAQPEFESVVDNPHADQEINSISVDMLPVIQSLFEGFDKFIQATHEAEDGNTEKADELISEGFDIFNQALS